MEPLILFIIIMAISSFFKKRGQQRRAPSRQPRAPVTPDEPAKMPPLPGKQELTLEFDEKKWQKRERPPQSHKADKREKAALKAKGERERKRDIQKYAEKETKLNGKDTSHPNSNLFKSRGSLRQGIVMAEILGPPRAKRKTIR